MKRNDSLAETESFREREKKNVIAMQPCLWNTFSQNIIQAGGDLKQKQLRSSGKIHGS